MSWRENNDHNNLYQSLLLGSNSQRPSNQTENHLRMAFAQPANLDILDWQKLKGSNLSYWIPISLTCSLKRGKFNKKVPACVLFQRHHKNTYKKCICVTFSGAETGTQRTSAGMCQCLDIVQISGVSMCTCIYIYIYIYKYIWLHI